MNRTGIRISVILGVVTILLVTGVQIYFVRNAYNQEEQQLNHSIQQSLRAVSENMARFNDSDLPHDNPIQRLKSDYYVVNVNGYMEAEILEYYLLREFQNRNLELDFEFGIYDCQTDEMVYGRYVTYGETKNTNPMEYSFSKYSDYLYYFGIYFPGISKYVLSNLGVWYFFSIVLFFVLIFFVYTQIVMLRQRQLSEIQKDFISNLTHELRTPLAAIQMSAEVFSDQELDQDPVRFQRYGHIIKTKTKDLLSQIDRILYQSGPVAKKTFVPSSIDLNTLIKSAVEECLLRLNGHGSLDLRIIPKETQLEADPVLIKQLLDNVLDNACKYSPSEPKVKIELTEIKKAYLLKFEDKGIGIPDKLQKKVFNRFYRVSTGNVHTVKGFGLGLYHVKKVAKLHRWKMQLSSQVGRGTIIEFWIKK